MAEAVAWGGVGEVKLVRPTALLVYRGAQNPVQRFDWVANQTFHRHPDICGCRGPQPVQVNEWTACLDGLLIFFRWDTLNLAYTGWCLTMPYSSFKEGIVER